MTRTLDLGSGPAPINPFGFDEVYGVDIYNTGNANVRVADLVIEPIPFEDNYFDGVTAIDFLEHLPRTLYIPSASGGVKRINPFIDVMSEAYRVLKPGGQFLAKTPAYPTHEAFQDPTHVNIITENTQYYFTGIGLHLCHIYGFKGEFKLIRQEWEGYWLVWHFEAVK